MIRSLGAILLGCSLGRLLEVVEPEDLFPEEEDEEELDFYELDR